jgi:hypothetical protein
MEAYDSSDDATLARIRPPSENQIPLTHNEYHIRRGVLEGIQAHNLARAHPRASYTDHLKERYLLK